ncbi:Decarboxylase tropJ [Lachnellula suecica]|uniref:Decarboxylase tropJ n=1 Tax=Lachnellula suecica TaxID=602035 RepID=A0A8T9CGW3_9HELO|nr:Decarboxylase tropJ [Lachnellula suecica]
MASRDYEAELQTLITANRILYHQNVVDAYGHVSFRHPDKPDIFIMSGDKAPALVSSPSDLIEYHVGDSSPVDPSAKKGYQERFIHSELYKRYPEINSVVHSHSQAVLPYTMNGVAMQPTFHIAGFLGTHVPNYDITRSYKTGDSQDMLVNTTSFGSDLASTFSSTRSKDPTHTVVVMANHGFTAVGTSIKQAVYRAVYTHVNAGIQSNAIMLRSAQEQIKPGSTGEIRYLNEVQTAGSLKMNEASLERPWGLWEHEAKAWSLVKKPDGV